MCHAVLLNGLYSNAAQHSGERFATELPECHDDWDSLQYPFGVHLWYTYAEEQGT